MVYIHLIRWFSIWYVRIFCELRGIFPSPAGARKNTSNVYYSTTKKNYLAFGFYFLVRVFRDILILSVRMTLTISKMFARIICQTIGWEVNYFTATKKMVFWLLFSNESIQNILILSATVAPFASAGVRPVVNQLNQDTTVYYGLVFCLFSWPYMVKWHNSGIIKLGYFIPLIRRLILTILNTSTKKKRSKDHWNDGNVQSGDG